MSFWYQEKMIILHYCVTIVVYSIWYLRHFLQRVRIAMQSAVIARGILSVRPSVTFRYCVQMNEDTIVWFSAAIW